MAKKKLDKEAERTPSSPGKIAAILKNETVHFVIGLMLVIFSVYLLLAFSSFFFTGAADQSIIDSGNPADLSAVNNHVKNYAGSRGAQLAHYLINDCFGVSSFFILVFLAVAGLKLMRVRVVRLWKWFIGCTLLLVWFSIFFGFVFMDHYQDSFIYLGGMHGYNVSRWLISQVGVPGVSMRYWIASVRLATPFGNVSSSRFCDVRFASALVGTYTLPLASFLSIWHDMPESLPLPRCR